MKGRRYALDVFQADVPAATLDVAQVGAVDAREIGQGLLGESRVFTEPTHPAAERAPTRK